VRIWFTPDPVEAVEAVPAFAACAGTFPGSSATAAHAIVERLMNFLRFIFMVYSSLIY
jgi:hypothetical protein